MNNKQAGEVRVPEEAVEAAASEDYMASRFDTEQSSWSKLPVAEKDEWRKAARRYLAAALPAIEADLIQRLGKGLGELPRSYCTSDEHGPLMDEGESGEWLRFEDVRTVLDRATAHSFSLEEE